MVSFMSESARDDIGDDFSCLDAVNSSATTFPLPVNTVKMACILPTGKFYFVSIRVSLTCILTVGSFHIIHCIAFLM